MLTYIPKDVSADPGPEAVPTTSGSGGRDRLAGNLPPVVDGLGARAADPEEAEPLEHRQQLVGERPATGSNESPG